ncbi:unnamed protein product [Ectocarpus sp. 13 AM-2016]
MEPEEVQAVIAHELGHLKCEHGIWVTLATVVANGLYGRGFLGAFVADRLGLRRRLMRWSRAAEFTCDRAAMLVAQDVNVVVSTLLKLAGGSVSQASELSVPEFLKQASAYDLASQTRIGKLLKREQSLVRKDDGWCLGCWYLYYPPPSGREVALTARAEHYGVTFGSAGRNLSMMRGQWSTATQTNHAPSVSCSYFPHPSLPPFRNVSKLFMHTSYLAQAAVDNVLSTFVQHCVFCSLFLLWAFFYFSVLGTQYGNPRPLMIGV